MVIPVTTISQLAEAAYKSRYSKGDAALIEGLLGRCQGELHKNTLVAKHGAIEFKLAFLPKQQGFKVTVACRNAGRFRVSRKGALDRWMEGFVPAWRFRSRDESFDRDFSVQTRDLEFTSAILAKPTGRSAVRELFERGVLSVQAEGEKVTTICGRKVLGAKPVAEDVLGLVEQLSRIAGAVTRFAAHHEVRLTPKIDPVVALSWIALGLLGVLGFVMVIAGGVEYTLVRPASFLLPCALFGLPSIAPVVVILAFVVSRRTSPYGLVTGLSALAMLVVPLFISGGMLLSNGILDDKPAAEHVVTVVGRSVREDKNKMKYHAGLESWWTEGEVRWVRVSKATYDLLESDVTLMHVWTRPGKLGYEWLDDYRIAP
jgi:hypothetical protein